LVSPLGGILQLDGYLQVDPVGLDVAVLYTDVHILDPAPSTPLSVLVARATATLMASSKLVSDVALNSVTRAMLMVLATLTPSLPLIYTVCSLNGQISNIRERGLQLNQYSQVGQAPSRVKKRVEGHRPRGAKYPTSRLRSCRIV
jgi:hypothetical protein